MSAEHRKNEISRKKLPHPKKKQRNNAMIKKFAKANSQDV